MKTPTVNARPIYYAVPEPDMPGCDYGLEPLPARAGFFEVREVRDGKHDLIFTLHNGGDRLGNLLKRGIPVDDARTLFFQMDS